MDDHRSHMVDPFGEVSFLTRSENRVEVLETLATGEYSERDIVEATGISDVTVGRILDDFEQRGWVREGEEGYTTTAVGDLLAADYERFHGSMDLACRLGPVLEYLPTDEMDFDFRHLTEARVSDPENFDLLRALDRWIELTRQSDHIVGIAPAPNAAEVVAEPFHEEIVENDLDFETVVSPDYLETTKRRPELRGLLRDMIRAGAGIYLAPEGTEITTAIAIYDHELTAITGFDETGALRVGIESRADPVREWARDRYDRLKAEARPLEPEDFER